MHPSDDARRRLHDKITSEWGAEYADTLFSVIPDEDPDDLARNSSMLAGFDQVNARFADVDRKFAEVDQRFEAMDQRFDAMDQRFDAMDHRLGELEGATRALGQRLVDYQSDMFHHFSGVESRLGSVQERFAGVETRLAGVETKVGSVAVEVAKWNLATMAALVAGVAAAMQIG